MKPGSRRYTFETIRSGQPRPYADSVHEFLMTAEWIPLGGTDWVPNDSLNEQLVKRQANGFCQFKESDDKPDWHESKLTSFTKDAPARWRFVVTTAFTD